MSPKIDYLMRKPYKEWIKLNIKGRSLEDLEEELMENSLILPDDIHEQMPQFMDVVLKLFLGNKKLWKTQSMDISGLMLTLAREKIPSLSNYDGKDFGLFCGTIFNIVTLFLSSRAAKYPEFRKIIGIRLGLFSR